MPQKVLALPAPANGAKTETVSKNNTQTKTNSKLKVSQSFSGSASRLGVANASTYQTPSVGHRRIDQMLRDHNMEMRKYQGNPSRLWMTTVQLHQNLEDMEQEASNALTKARSASKKARSNPNSPKNEQKRLDEKVRKASKKHLQIVSGIEKAESLVGKRGREGPSGSATPQLKRTKSTEIPLATKNANASRQGTNQKQQRLFPQIFPVKTEVNYLREKAELEKKIKLMGERLERQAALIEEFKKTQRSNSNSETVPITKINTAEINRLKRELNALKKARISPGNVEKMKKKLNAYEKQIKELTKTTTKVSKSTQVTPKSTNNTSRNSMNRTPGARRALEHTFNQIAKQKNTPPKRNTAPSQTGNQNPSSSTPTKQGIPKPTTAPSQTQAYTDAKKQGAEELSEERRRRLEKEGPPAARRALEPTFNQVAKQKNTPPGITKTNIERLLQPFKQPVTVKFAPTISVKGGSGGSLKQVQIQHKSPVDKKKKKPLKFTRGPATARKQESAKFRNAIISKLRSPVAAKRREALYSLRTPTTGQRKKHVIELIDRVLRRMKVRADVEKKLIKFYESLSERHIKQLFGGRTKEGVKTILKKQVDYFSKKR